MADKYEPEDFSVISGTHTVLVDWQARCLAAEATVAELANLLEGFTDEPKSLGDLRGEYRRKLLASARAALARVRSRGGNG